MLNTQRISLSTGLFIFGALLSITLLILRLMNVISFTEPMHVVTSGFEEESLFAMWKMLHRLPVYTDPHQVPFSASYFNWLFYTLYGGIIRFIVDVFGMNEAFLPTIGRTITFVIVSLGCAINYILLQHFNDKKSLPKGLILSFCVLLWYGPLIGYWAITVRPDLLGLLFDLCAIYFLFKHFPKYLTTNILLAALCCYLSWACKQVNIAMPMAIGLFLLSERKWQACFTFSALLVSCYSVTLLFAPLPMMKMLLFIGTAVPLSLSVFTANLITFIKKTLPVWILLATLIVKLCFDNKARQTILHDKIVKFSLCGMLCWALTLLIASSKVGSAENYHFIALLFLLIGLTRALSLLWDNSKILENGTRFAGLAFAGSIIFVLLQGPTVTIDKQKRDYLALKSCITKLPTPVFVINHYGALPWMNPSSVSFVLAYNYWNDRSAARPFESDGIGGLISQGYFNSLILPIEINDNFDTAPLNQYQREKTECSGYAVFTKKGIA